MSLWPAQTRIGWNEMLGVLAEYYSQYAGAQCPLFSDPVDHDPGRS